MARKRTRVARVAMEGPLTIYEAARHKEKLLEALHGATKLEIDLSHVAEMDTAGIQLLVLVKREALRENKQVRLLAHSPASLEVIDMYRLGGYFGDPVVISSRRNRA